MEDVNELINFGIINIDKPSGPTSFQVSQFIKKTLCLKKTTHLGTLDPQVSGVLPVATGRACRLSDFFMHKNKTYIGIMRLHEKVPKKVLEENLEKFLGKITQLPPVRSRVKRAEREREIYTFKILEVSGKDVLFESEVEAGTYIRKLIHDFGLALPNSPGAHMLELRRTRAGIFSEEKIYTLYDFENALEDHKKGDSSRLREMIVPAQIALQEVLPKIIVSENLIPQILTGKPLLKKDYSEDLPDGNFAIFNKDKLIAIMGKVSEGEIIARPKFVLN